MRRLLVLAGLVMVVLVGVSASSVRSTHAATQGRWVIRDLGTVNDDYSFAVAINRHRQIACNSWLGDMSEAALDAIPYMNESGYTAFLWQNGKRRKLTLGRPGSRIVAMNERGQIVGGAAVKTKGGDTVSHAFLWQNRKMTDLGTLGGPSSVAYAINERGQVVGWADTTAKVKNYRGDWVPAHHAFLWQKGNMTDLGTLGGSESEPVAINERGQVVGWADAGATGGSISRAFLWENGEMRDLGTLGGDESYAAAINDRGQVVGRADTKKDDPLSDHAFLWQKGKMRDLGTFGGPNSYATAINERGQVIGAADIKAKEKDADDILCCVVEHAFVWQKGKLRDLGTLGGPRSEAVAINERGQVVGEAETPTFLDLSITGRGRYARLAFLWQNGKMRNLGALPWEYEGSRYTGDESSAYDINESDQIVGWAENGSDHAVLWTYKP